MLTKKFKKFNVDVGRNNREGGGKLYDYSKLRGRIVEKFGSGRAFAEALGITNVTVSRKLQGSSEFSKSDIESWSALLDISESEYGSFYFAHKV